MKIRRTGILALLACCAAGIACVTAPARPLYTQPRPVTVAVVSGAEGEPFYEDLAPYGRWIYISGPGWVWAPYDVGPGWAPYQLGHWVFTDYGWTWASDEEFGWATYHYGRWHNDRAHGWVWVPGTDWGPAWVAWHEGGGWIGWAPLPYQVRWRAEVGLEWGGMNINVAIGPSAWHFVPARYMVDPGLRSRMAPPSRNVSLIQITRNVTHYTYVDHRIVDRSVRVEHIGRAVGHPIPRYRVRQTDSRESARGGRERGEDFVVFKPNPVRRGKSQGQRTRPGSDSSHDSAGLGQDGHGDRRGDDSNGHGSDGRDERRHNGPDGDVDNGPDGRVNNGPDGHGNNGPDGRVDNGPNGRGNNGRNDRGNNGPGGRGNDGPDGRVDDGRGDRGDSTPDDRGDSGRNGNRDDAQDDRRDSGRVEAPGAESSAPAENARPRGGSPFRNHGQATEQERKPGRTQRPVPSETLPAQDSPAHPGPGAAAPSGNGSGPEATRGRSAASTPAAKAGPRRGSSGRPGVAKPQSTGGGQSEASSARRGSSENRSSKAKGKKSTGADSKSRKQKETKKNSADSEEKDSKKQDSKQPEQEASDPGN